MALFQYIGLLELFILLGGGLSGLRGYVIGKGLYNLGLSSPGWSGLAPGLVICGGYGSFLALVWLIPGRRLWNR